jgi:hypothetical protein
VRPRSEPAIIRLSLIVEAPAAGRLAGVEMMKNGWRNGLVTTASPQFGLRTLVSSCVVDHESGGVTGALLETCSCGRP